MISLKEVFFLPIDPEAVLFLPVRETQTMPTKGGNKTKFAFETFNINEIYEQIGRNSKTGELLSKRIADIETDYNQKIKNLKVRIRRDNIGDILQQFLPEDRFEVHRTESFLRRYPACLGIRLGKRLPITKIEGKLAITRLLFFHQLDFFYDTGMEEFKRLKYELVYTGNDTEGLREGCIEDKVRRRSINDILSKQDMYEKPDNFWSRRSNYSFYV